MKILYLFDLDLDVKTGVSNKISMQSKYWKNNGHEVILLSLLSLSFFSVEGKRISEQRIKVTRGKLGFLINRYKSSFLLKKILENINFDIVYLRYIPYDPFFKNSCLGKPIIAEMNTVYERETKQRSFVSFLYYSLFKKLSMNSINGFVCISNEIKNITVNNKPNSIVIANGIDLNNIPKKINCRNINKRPQIVFIGSPNQPWHGVDKIIYLSVIIKNYDFHIIGQDGINTDNLFYHGYLFTDDANKLLMKCDIGIGSLAMHRLSMNEASPLKSRQYLALGLPIIYAYADTDLTNEYDFALKLPNSENNIKDNIDIICKFIDEVFQNKNIHESARSFAIEKLNIKVKEKTRLKFLQSFL